MKPRRVVVLFELETDLPLHRLRKLVRADFADIPKPGQPGVRSKRVFREGDIPERATVRLAASTPKREAER